jgi:hypothetical protein
MEKCRLAAADRHSLFDEVVAKEKERIEEDMEVFSRANRCLDSLLSAYNPGKSPRKYPLEATSQGLKECYSGLLSGTYRR